ncbi:MAG: hypothetical protein PHS07_03695 [Patescibacteria group bacterium]|jgi:hypothetical protein|nr:hypothetical protein [Patescibacteria group bacterium]
MPDYDICLEDKQTYTRYYLIIYRAVNRETAISIAKCRIVKEIAGCDNQRLIVKSCKCLRGPKSPSKKISKKNRKQRYFFFYRKE